MPSGEQLRTYALATSGKLVPARRLVRGGDCVRWITGLAGDELSGNRRGALLAVVSRDGRRVIAAGRAGRCAGFSMATNTLFTCLHTDSACPVPPNGRATTRQLFWFLDGTLDDLLDRFHRDFADE